MKLAKDNKIIKNVNIPKINFQIIKTSRITICATAPGICLLSGYNKPGEKVIIPDKEYISGCTNNYKETTLTYEDVFLNKCLNKIKDYSYVFNVKDEVVLNVIKNNIKNKESYDNILNDDKTYESLDIQIILLSKDISKHPKDYGYDENEVYLDVPKISNKTIRELVYKYADAFNLDSDIMLSIPCAESGWFEAPIAKTKNNPYSYRLSSGEFATFDSLERGILEGELNLKLNYFDKGLTDINSFGHIYCPVGTSDWINLVNSAYNEIKNGKKLYDEEEKKLALKGRN